MERVLIISYFFPPCSLTASQRTGFWAENLIKFGYRPIVLTRHWDKHLKKIKDASLPSEKPYEFKNLENHDIHFLPYKGNLRDKLYEKYGEKKFYPVRAVLTFLELIFQLLFVKIIPSSNIYFFARKLLKENRDIKKVIISGNPFNQFHFGYLLNKEFGVSWIADYRDAWSTSTINDLDRSSFFKLLLPLERLAEKKWVGSASRITSVSPPLAQDISELVKVKQEVLYNGFVSNDFLLFNKEEKAKDFTIVHAGTLYQGQDITVFCSAVKKLIDSRSNITVRILFLGIGANKRQVQRIKDELLGYEAYFELTDRLPRQDILKIEKKAHLLYYPAWKGHKGIIASKLYEYLASKTPVLVSPGDNSCVDDIINHTKAGKVCNTIEETLDVLLDVYNHYLQGKDENKEADEAAISEYSRERQVEKLSEILAEI